METNYEKLIKENLKEFYTNPPSGIENFLPAEKTGNEFHFKAFGEDCCVSPSRITLSGNTARGPKGLLVSLYASHASHESMKLQPFFSFKDLPGSMPYQGAFSANSERVLVPFVPKIADKAHDIKKSFNGEDAPDDFSGDLSFLLFPLPKIALAYIFYLPDDEFPPSATCLFSSNALSFMPLDGLADVAEYTGKGIIDIVRG